MQVALSPSGKGLPPAAEQPQVRDHERHHEVQAALDPVAHEPRSSSPPLLRADLRAAARA